MPTPSNPVTVTPWLRRDQWSRFCELFAGEDPLPPSYDHWLEESQGAVIGMSQAGFKVRRVVIDIEELADWCKTQNRVVDPLSMMLFSSVVVARHDDPGAPPPEHTTRKVGQEIRLKSVSGARMTIHTLDKSVPRT